MSKAAWLLLLVGCGSPEQTFAPDVILVERNLAKPLREILEATIESELCAEVEDRGFECSIPAQLKSIRFEWLHNDRGTVRYGLEYCLKADCPEEEE